MKEENKKKIKCYVAEQDFSHGENSCSLRRSTSPYTFVLSPEEGLLLLKKLQRWCFLETHRSTQHEGLRSRGGRRELDAKCEAFCKHKLVSY